MYLLSCRANLAQQQQQHYACSNSPLVPAPSSRPQQQQQQQQQRPLLQPPSAAAGGAALPAQPANDPPAREVAPLQPIKLAPAAVAIAFGFLVNFVVPAPAGITPQAWTLFSVFLSTILGLVLQPLPVGAWAFLGLCVVVATKTLPFAKVSQQANCLYDCICAARVLQPQMHR
jgi:DASS family divalent anion:Na+ symporter